MKNQENCDKRLVWQVLQEFLLRMMFTIYERRTAYTHHHQKRCVNIMNSSITQTTKGIIRKTKRIYE